MVVVYQPEDVAKHNTTKDLWVTLHGKVYDLTSYADDHPGGIAALMEVAGQDGTIQFEDLGHGADARDLMGHFLVGKLDRDEELTPQKIVRQLAPAVSVKVLSNKSFTLMRSLINFCAMSMALAIGYNCVYRISTYSARRYWSMSAAASNLLPWAFSASLASYLINQYIQPHSPQQQRPRHAVHFQPTNVVARPKHGDSPVLTPHQFTELQIASIEKLTSDSNKIVVALPTQSSVLGLPVGQHIVIRGLVNGKPLNRSYTPTSSNQDRGRLELVVKNYADGQLTGNYLQHVRVGDKLSVSGPRGQMRYRRGFAKTIGMIAGGTGITPMYQLIRAICEDPRDTTQVHLIYANRTERDILLKEELDTFAREHADQLTIHYLLSKPDADWTGMAGRCTEELVRKTFAHGAGDKASTKAMLCGPPGMVDHAKQWLINCGYDQPHAVSKMQDQVFVF